MKTYFYDNRSRLEYKELSISDKIKIKQASFYVRTEVLISHLSSRLIGIRPVSGSGVGLKIPTAADLLLLPLSMRIFEDLIPRYPSESIEFALDIMCLLLWGILRLWNTMIYDCAKYGIWKRVELTETTDPIYIVHVPRHWDEQDIIYRISSTSAIRVPYNNTPIHRLLDILIVYGADQTTEIRKDGHSLGL